MGLEMTSPNGSRTKENNERQVMDEENLSPNIKKSWNRLSYFKNASRSVNKHSKLSHIYLIQFITSYKFLNMTVRIPFLDVTILNQVMLVA